MAKNKILIGVGTALAVLSSLLLFKKTKPPEPPPPPPGKANLYGLVTDSITGNELSGSSLTLNGFYGVTEDGYFAFTELDPKRYTGTVSRDRYETYYIDVTLEEGDNYEFNIALVPIPTYPEVAQATCPYSDATTFYAPSALEELFEHVLDANHIDITSPWCLFCGEEFEPEDTEWKTVRKVVDHWVEVHLEKLTAIPGGGKVYVEGLPAQAMPGNQITVEHGFELEQAPGEYRIVLGFKSLSGLSGFSGATHTFDVSQTGMYEYTETIQIPAGQWEGQYIAVSRCIYKQYNPDLEYVVWEVEVGEIYIGEEVPPPPPAGIIPCVYCAYEPTDEMDLISHMETDHPGQPYPISGRLEPASVSRTSSGYVITPVKFLLKFFAPEGTHPPSQYGDEFYQVYVDVDGWQSRDARPLADGNFHDLELIFDGYWRCTKTGFYEVWINCGQYWYTKPQHVEGIVWFKDKPTEIWLKVE